MLLSNSEHRTRPHHNSFKDDRATGIFILFSTHNGGSVLREVLDGYTRLIQPRRPWTIVVIDNASNDATPEILRSFETRLPLVILNEAVPGKNQALNHALDSVDLGRELYIFSDDDAIPDRDFLTEWEAILDRQPEHELFGGTVALRFRETPPAWLQRYSAHFAELFAQNERPSGAIAADEIFGPNMAVRGSVLRRNHRFNEAIGPNAALSDYPMGSETEFCTRVEKDLKNSAFFAAGPRVQHIVRPHQMSRDFVGRRAFRHGRGFAMRHSLAHGPLKKPGLKAACKEMLLRMGAAAPAGSLWWHYNWQRGFTDWTSKSQ